MLDNFIKETNLAYSKFLEQPIEEVLSNLDRSLQFILRKNSEKNEKNKWFQFFNEDTSQKAP